MIDAYDPKLGQLLGRLNALKKENERLKEEISELTQVPVYVPENHMQFPLPLVLRSR